MGPCCVHGCNGISEDVSFFEFPTSRGLRRQWLKMLQISSKVPLGTVVCSQHFNREDYEIVRGKVRLKRKVVPSLQLQNDTTKSPSPVNTPESPEKKLELPVEISKSSDEKSKSPVDKSRSPVDKSKSPVDKLKSHVEKSNSPVETEKSPVEKSNSPVETPKSPVEKTNSPVETAKSPVEKTNSPVETAKSPVEKTNSPVEKTNSPVDTVKSPVEKSDSPVETAKSPVEKSKSPVVKYLDIPLPPSTPEIAANESTSPSPSSYSEIETTSLRGEKTELCRVVTKKRKRSGENEKEVPPLPDPKQPPDFEDMITNYQIKINKPLALLSQEMDIEVPPASERDDTIVLDGKGDEPPVFIEISVDKDNSAANASSQDCLMVLESVQVEVDPSTLMLPERDFEEELELEDSDSVTKEVNVTKKDDPISLLTSSDEDEVIIQEPHIDTVEVSDETDEDDVPLVNLLKTKSTKKKKQKNLPATSEELRKLVWNGAYDFYCMQCHYSTSNSMEYNLHLQEHNKVLQVCHICNYTTASKTQLGRHLRKHKEEKKFKCHLCKYRARHNMSLIYHIQCHEKDRECIKSVKKGYKCIKCGFRAHLKSTVLSHVRNCSQRHLNTFSCDECSYVTKRKSDLKRHASTRHQHDDDIEILSDSSINAEHPFGLSLRL